jgi:hypothetical protein
MEVYTETTKIENRGKISGVIMLISGLGVFVFYLIWPLSSLALGIILALWRLSSILVFYAFRDLKPQLTAAEIPSFKKILRQQSCILYLIPWVLFSLVNYFSGAVQLKILGDTTFGLVSTIQSLMIGIFAIIGGFLLDSFGRKRIAISGFILLGIDYATLGVFPTSILANYFSACIDGVAWGFLLVIFVVTIWGDLSQGSKSSKYYAIGVSPFFFSKLLELTVGTGIASFILGVAGNNGLFSFLSFFLFIAVLPLIYAPETLPDKVMKDRDLKSYIEKAVKKAQVEEEKNQKKSTHNQGKYPFETQVKTEGKEEDIQNNDEYEKARQLAEKYY